MGERPTYMPHSALPCRRLKLMSVQFAAMKRAGWTLLVRGCVSHTPPLQDVNRRFAVTCAMCYSRRIAEGAVMWSRAIGVAIGVLLLWVSTGQATPQSSPCLGTGMTVGSYPGCWFLGLAGDSCMQTCAAQGLAYDDKSRTVVGSDASTGDACFEIASALDSPPDSQSENPCVDALGCFIDKDSNNKVFWCESPTTTATAAHALDERICACMTAGAAAPALSPGSLAVTAVLLGASGILLIRRARQ